MTILVFGTFDGLHPGHRFVLAEGARRAAAMGGVLVVIVARDANVRRIKGRDPASPEAVRVRAIAEAFPQARVLLGDSDDFLSPVRALLPRLILLGYDQRLPPGVTLADLESFGALIERLPGFEPEKWKSSLIREDSPPAPSPPFDSAQGRSGEGGDKQNIQRTKKT